MTFRLLLFVAVLLPRRYEVVALLRRDLMIFRLLLFVAVLLPRRYEVVALLRRDLMILHFLLFVVVLLPHLYEVVALLRRVFLDFPSLILAVAVHEAVEIPFLYCCCCCSSRVSNSLVHDEKKTCHLSWEGLCFFPPGRISSARVCLKMARRRRELVLRSRGTRQHDITVNHCKDGGKDNR